MNKADKYFFSTLSKLAMDGNDLKLTGDTESKYKDGETAHTLFDTNAHFEYDLSKGEFPITSFRRVYWKSAIKEILWIYQDMSNDLTLLKDKYNVHYWDEFDIGDGTIGLRYGAMVKKYDIINKEILGPLREDPTYRRSMIDLWQYQDMRSSEGLPSCAFNAIFMVRGEYLDMMMTQRSSDFIMAWSINQIQYVALQMMIAYDLGLKPGKFTHNVANIHIYDRHKDIALKLLSNDITKQYSYPKLLFRPVADSFKDFTIGDFSVEDYNPVEFDEHIELAIGNYKCRRSE